MDLLPISSIEKLHNNVPHSEKDTAPGGSAGLLWWRQAQAGGHLANQEQPLRERHGLH